jgi:hypothetical protein
MRRCLILTVLALGVSPVLLAPTPAQAAFARTYTGDSFGPQGISAGKPLGAFSNLQSVTVQQSTGDVYVYDAGFGGGSVYKFNSAGEAEDFSALSANVIEGVGVPPFGESGESEIAVDSSSGSTEGDIYLAAADSLKIYGPDGKKSGELTNGGPWGEPCGVAVDSAGNVYVALFEGGVNKYTPTSATVTNADYVSSLSGFSEPACNIAADSEGNVYVNTFATGPVTKYAASQFNVSGTPASGNVVDQRGSTLGVEPFTNEVLIDEVGAIAQYEPSGNLLGKFGETGAGALGESYGVAIDHASGQVYADDHSVVEIFGPGVVSADVSIQAVSDLTPVSATLHGTVSPDETTVTACKFEYGTKATYGQSALCSPPTPYSGSSAVPVTADLAELESNTTYHYALLAANSAATAISRPDQTFTTPPGPPVLGAPTSSEVTPFGATLSDTLNPENAPTGTTSYYFEYGSTSAYGQRFPVEGNAGDGSTAVPAVQTITGLTPGTTYHYALVATNSAGATTSSDQTFTTLSAAAPAVSTGAASAVTQYEATLSGALDPQGLQTSYHFDIGADTNYGTQVFGPTIVSPSTVTLPLQNLQPGTTYHYRLTATNSAGTTYGSDQTFTTAGVAPVITQPLTPLLLATPNIAFPTEPGTTKPKALTNAQKLAAALKACKKKAKGKRAACRRQARRKYGPVKKKKK